jgi:hypothetical protein
MIASVPGDVDEPDQHALVGSRRHPAEAEDLVPPAGQGVTTMRTHKLDHFLVAQLGVPCEDDPVHGARLELPIRPL